MEKTPNNAQKQPAGSSEDSANKSAETLHIVIRDVDPPLPALVLRGVMHGICAVLLLCVCALGIPRLFGVQEFNVLTGSMTPAYPVGTLVFTAPCDPAEIQAGDVVTCVMNEDLDVITHRVVANDPAAGTITTRGDANNSDDAPTLYENVVGVVKFSVPGIGGVINYFTTTEQGRIAGIALLASIVLVTLLAETLCNHLSRQTISAYAEDDESELSL